MRLEIAINGMSCHHCVKTVRTELEKIPGVSLLDVQIGKAFIEMDERPDSRDLITNAVEKAGYAIEAIN